MYFVFFVSGFSALLYQVVWQRLLTVHYGVGAVSTAVIVAIYMAGLGIGSAAGGMLAVRTTSQYALYSGIELLIGAFGAASLPVLDALGRGASQKGPLAAYSAIALFLLFPTLLMGATLPLLTSIVNRMERDLLRTISALYFVNTLGAAAGAFLGAYFFISFFGLDTSLYFAAATNVLLAAFIWRLRSAHREESGGDPLGDQTDRFGRGAYLLVFVTGFLAIGYEIAWFRTVEVLIKASPYAFSTVLAIYLAGVALGSQGMDRWLRRRPTWERRRLFFSLQFLIGCYVSAAFTGLVLLTQHTAFRELVHASFSVALHPSPSWPASSEPGTFLMDLFTFVDFLAWPGLLVFIPTLFMGASFPLAATLACREDGHEAETVGWIAFSNILGNVLGGLGTGLLFLPVLGTENTLAAFCAVGLGFGFGAFPSPSRRRGMARLAFVLPAALLIGHILLFPKRGQLYAALHSPPGAGWTEYVEEGLHGVVVTYQREQAVHTYINGLGHGGRVNYIYGFYQRAIEALAHAPKVDEVLVIGYGTGAFVEAALKSPDVKHLRLVELNAALMTNLLKIPLFQKLLSDPRIETSIEDARPLIRREGKRYDLILMDPLRSTTAYSNNLYSREFFELAKSRLNEGGVLMVWLDEHRTLPKTVATVFEHVRRYRSFCLASSSLMRKNEIRERALMEQFLPEAQRQIREYDTYVGDRDLILSQAAAYPINTDRKPVCEYYLGLLGWLWWKARTQG